MNKSKWAVIVVLLLVLGSVLVTGCNIRINRLEVGDLQTDSQTVELGSAQEVTTNIKMGAGKLSITGGSEALMAAQFTYNVAKLKPEVSYEVSAGNGRLTVDQPDIENALSWNMDELRYEWDLQLNDDVPMDLAITVGAGESRLTLNSLSLDRLDFESGAGDVDIDLGGSTVRDLDVRMGAGDVRLDLSGNWQQNLAANLKGGVGRATVVLPTTTGVQVTVHGGLGKVNAAGLSHSGDVYTNDAYGQSDVTLNIDIEGGVGEINLVLAE